MSYVAECESCGIIESGDLEAVGDAVENHEQFHDVQISPVATDGGEDLPSLCDWPYAAVVHGADLRRDCLSLTGSGKPCSYQAYSGEDLCSTHQKANDPDVVEGAHQWARISDGDTTIAVCVNCEQVWRGGSPALAVDCPTCGRDAGNRCLIENSRSAGTNAPIPPHPARREAGREVLEDYTICSEAPGLGTSGGEQMALDSNLIEESGQNA